MLGIPSSATHDSYYSLQFDKESFDLFKTDTKNGVWGLFETEEPRYRHAHAHKGMHTSTQTWALQYI